MNRDQCKKLLSEIGNELGDVELRVVARVAQRLRMGQRQYGKFKPPEDKRDFNREMLEEILDAQVYASVSLEGMGEKGHAE